MRLRCSGSVENGRLASGKGLPNPGSDGLGAPISSAAFPHSNQHAFQHIRLTGYEPGQQAYCSITLFKVAEKLLFTQSNSLPEA